MLAHAPPILSHPYLGVELVEERELCLFSFFLRRSPCAWSSVEFQEVQKPYELLSFGAGLFLEENLGCEWAKCSKA